MFFIRNYKPVVFALIASGLIIGSTYLYVRTKKVEDQHEIPLTEEHSQEKLEIIPGLQKDDHILGNPAAPVLLFIYSDFSCPYCADYHETLKTIMRTHGSEGKVAVVFRHMPMVQLHPEAPMYALASECVASELGNASFWDFATDLFTLHNPLKPLTAAELVILAEEVGVSRQSFVACMRANTFMEKIERQYKEGIESGADGSPYTVVQAGNGERTQYKGAQSYRNLAIMLQTLTRLTEVGETGQESFVDTNGEVHFSNEFDVPETMLSSTTDNFSTTTSQKTPTDTEGQQKPESILDGIVPTQ